MDGNEIINILNEWQNQMMHSVSLVHVSWFELQPQADGFRLRIDFYIADKYNAELDDYKQDFYGSIDECVQAAIDYMENEKSRLKKLLC